MPRLRYEPKVPFSIADAPPPQEVMPTFMRLMPISVTTMPDTSGVIIFMAYLRMRLTRISANAPTMVAPKMAGSPPIAPAMMMGLMNEKLVPCTHNRPHPTPPKRLHWMNVAMPDTNRDMDTRKLVVSTSKPSAPDIISGGVMMATNIASRCCMAANRVSFKGGLSSSPYISPFCMAI